MGRGHPNKYDLSGDCGVLTIYSKKYGVFNILFDKEDFDKIKNIHWCIERDVKGKMYVRNRKIGKLHRIIMDTPKHLVVDHINHDTLDNRKSNLRNCTVSDNNKNTNLFNKYPNRTTRLYGISIWSSKKDKYTYTYFRVQYRGVCKCFKRLEDAKEFMNKLIEKRLKEVSND